MTERATPRLRRTCATAPPWRIAAAAALTCLLLAAASSAFANNYSRGNWLCVDFNNTEQNYNSDPENIYDQIAYALCLITRGDDSQGLAILNSIVDHSTHPARVKAAWMLANYIDTDGTLESVIDEDFINEAIEAYLKIIFFISLDPNYSNTNDLFEEESQMELKTNYRLPLLYSLKFKNGAIGNENRRLLSSPSYNGDGDLKTYQEYGPYTIDSLEKTIEFANQCLALPNKRHFESTLYKRIKAKCQVLKEACQALLPLERQSLALLDTDSCSADLPQCSEYYEIKDDMDTIIKQAISELEEI